MLRNVTSTATMVRSAGLTIADKLASQPADVLAGKFVLKGDDWKAVVSVTLEEVIITLRRD